MKRKYLYIAVFASVLVIVFYTIVKANSTGAVYGICGAPDDQVPGSCGSYTQGPNCHDIAPITNSNALQITMIDPVTSKAVTSYQSGKKYTIEIQLTYPTLIACGFESTIEIPNAPYTHEGTMTASTRSQIVYSPTSAPYATHYNSDRTSAHYGMWEYNWTAPTNYFGDLIIYAAGNSANGNALQTGDTIFNTNMTISHDAGIDNKTLNEANVSVYPNPASDNFTLSCSLAQEENTSIDLYDLKGQKIKSIQSGTLPQGENKLNVNVKGLPIGVYFVRITAEGESTVEKLMIGE